MNIKNLGKDTEILKRLYNIFVIPLMVCLVDYIMYLMKDNFPLRSNWRGILLYHINILYSVYIPTSKLLTNTRNIFV
jgi:hypothetical protein